MEAKNDYAAGKKMKIFFRKFDTSVVVGSITLQKKDLQSEVEFKDALQKAAEGFDNGTYTLNHDQSLFARFDMMSNQLVRLHKSSEMTGAIMPCWAFFS